MKIGILGSTGLLGNAVGKHFLNEYGEDDVFLSYRNKEFAYGKNTFEFKVGRPIRHQLPECDIFINCIGLIKQKQNRPLQMVRINTMFPLQLANYCKRVNAQLIHITTDCVFSGRDGNYTEESPHDCTDAYGKTKSLGEPADCMVLRTSIIGEELHSKVSFVEWAKSNIGQTVSGYTDHLWNGVTTQQYAKILDKIIEEDIYQEGTYHIFSNTVSKYELLQKIDAKMNLNLTINPVDTGEKINRSLSTIKNLNGVLEIPTLDQQISEMTIL